MRRKQHPDLVRRNAPKRRLLINQAFTHEIDRDADRCVRGELGGARLKKKEPPTLNGELYVLHVARRPLERFRCCEKIGVRFGQLLRKSG